MSWPFSIEKPSISPEDFPKSEFTKLEREYIVHYEISNINNGISKISSSIVRDGLSDQTEDISKTFNENYKDDPNFKLLSIYSKSTAGIDYELNNRMRCVRSICELGHRIRAEVKIRNRQPLKTAYVIFSNKKIQDFMLYLDGKDDQFASIIADELNVMNVVFVDGDTAKFFDYDLKPNFKVLGPKGYGQQAQNMKTILASMSIMTKSMLYAKLATGSSEHISGVNLVLEDFEVSLISKTGFASATGAVGAIVLDTKLDTQLISKGFVAEFRSAIQNIRKTAKLGLTDRIDLEVYCDIEASIDLLGNHEKLRKDLLANDIIFPKFEVIDEEVCHKINIDNKKLFVKMHQLIEKKEVSQ